MKSKMCSCQCQAPRRRIRPLQQLRYQRETHSSPAHPVIVLLSSLLVCHAAFSSSSINVASAFVHHRPHRRTPASGVRLIRTRIRPTKINTCKLTSTVVPEEADAPLFKAAPYLAMMGFFAAFAALPFAQGIIVADLNVGILYITAATALVVVGILMAGWSSSVTALTK